MNSSLYHKPEFLKPCASLETRNTICISVMWGGDRVGVGWVNNVHVKWHTHGMYVVQSGWGLVGGGVGAITFMSSGTRMECMLCSQGGDWWGGVGQ